MKSKRDLLIEYKKLLALLGMITTTTLVSGCSKEVDCPIEEQHAHIYVDEFVEMKRYVISEKERIDYSLRTDDYILVSDDKAKEINRANKYVDMYDIEMNMDYLSNYFVDNCHLEYEYLDVMKSPKHPIRIIHRWTEVKDLNDKYTGKERLVKKVCLFTVYKPVYTKDGNVEFESAVIEDLNEIPDGYTYITKYPRISEIKIYDEEQINEYKKEHNIRTR